MQLRGNYKAEKKYGTLLRGVYPLAAHGGTTSYETNQYLHLLKTPLSQHTSTRLLSAPLLKV